MHSATGECHAPTGEADRRAELPASCASAPDEQAAARGGIASGRPSSAALARRRHAAAAHHPPVPAAHRMREVVELPVSGRLLGLHALPRGAELPRPRQQRKLPKADAQQLGVSSSQLQAAQQACQHLLPNSGGAIDADSVEQCMMAGDCPRALVQQVLDEERRFARCMRSHGVPNWPDPSIDSQGRPVFAISISKLGFDPVFAAGLGQGQPTART